MHDHGMRAYLSVIKKRAQHFAEKAPGSYDAHYWRIEIETGGALTAAELHRRAMQAELRSKKR